MHIERDRNARTIFLNQTRYITKVLERFGIRDCKGISAPMEAAPLPPCQPNIDEAVNRVEYQSKVGNIMYAMLGTRHDLAYAVSALSKFNLCPITAHHGPWAECFDTYKQRRTWGSYIKVNPIRPPPSPSSPATWTQTGEGTEKSAGLPAASS